MIAELFIYALLGHLIGDFLLQPKEMALRKSQSGSKGLVICTIHVLVYTVAICAMMGTFSPPIFLGVYVPHWVIDRWSLADKWCKLIRGRTFKAAYASKDQYREFDIAFTCVVYTVVDSTFHLLCLFAVIKYMM